MRVSDKLTATACWGLLRAFRSEGHKPDTRCPARTLRPQLTREKLAVVSSKGLDTRQLLTGDSFLLQVLAATQTPTDKEWFQGTADAVRQYTWLFEDIKNRVVQDIIILSGDHLCAAPQ